MAASVLCWVARKDPLDLCQLCYATERQVGSQGADQVDLSISLLDITCQDINSSQASIQQH